MWRSPYPRENWEETRRYSPPTSLEDISSLSSIQSILNNRESKEQPKCSPSDSYQSDDNDSSSTLPDLIIERIPKPLFHDKSNHKKSYDKLEIFIRKYLEDTGMKDCSNSNLNVDEVMEISVLDPASADDTESNAHENLNMSDDSRSNSWLHIDTEIEGHADEDDFNENFENDTINKDLSQLSTIVEVTEDEIEDEIEDTREEAEVDEDYVAFRIDDELKEVFDDKAESIIESIVSRSHSRTFTEKSDDLQPSKDSLYEVQSLEVEVEFHAENDNESDESVQLNNNNDQTSLDLTQMSTNNIKDHDTSEIEVIRGIESPNSRNNDSIRILGDEEPEIIDDVSFPSGLDKKRSFSLPQNVDDNNETIKEKKRKRDSSQHADIVTSNDSEIEISKECSPPKNRRKGIETTKSVVTQTLLNIRSIGTQMYNSGSEGTQRLNLRDIGTQTADSSAREKNNWNLVFSPFINNIYF